MIGRITGQLIEKNPPLICINVNGVGYDIDVPMSTYYQLPALNETTTLYTHLAVRDDAQQLFGFLSHDERQTFRSLIKVSGIGARTALAILSGISIDDLVLAVQQQEITLLVKIPGIGQKTAHRLILELQGKLTPSSTHMQSNTNRQTDILNALLALGYSEKESTKALKTIDSNLDVSQGIKEALKFLVR